MDAGDLVPDDVVLGIISERLALPDAENGFHSRWISAHDATGTSTSRNCSIEMGTPLDTAVLMDVDFDILMKRLTGRRTCSITGTLLNVHYSSKEELEACTNAGGELIQREDDNEETISNRLDVYRENTEPLIDFYRKRGKLVTINAEGTIDEVYDRLLEALPS